MASHVTIGAVTTLPTAARAVLVAVRARLPIAVGTQWPLGDLPFSIGRGATRDLRIEGDDQVSRLHARIERRGTAYWLVDLSDSGTFVNGESSRSSAERELHDGDRIAIGRSILGFACGDDLARRCDALVELGRGG
jgi:predicted component of type VI protein secretion system